MNNENRKAKIRTYLVQLQEGNIRGNQMEVLDFIFRNNGTTVHEMRTALAMAHQSLTPSISNLLDCGLIYEIGQVKIGDSFYSKFAFEPDSEKQDELATARKKEKFAQWVRMGIKEFDDLMNWGTLNQLKSEL